MVNESSSPESRWTGLQSMVVAINGSKNRYAEACGAIFFLMASLKLDSEDKLDVLDDVSDALDGMQASPRSGLITMKKK